MQFERDKSEIFIRPAMESEVDGISDFLAEHFSTGNPMELSYIYKQDDRKQQKKKDSDEHSNGFILNAIVSDHVLVAIKVSTSLMVGVLISDIINSTSSGHLISPPTTPTSDDENRAEMDIPNFLAYINAKSNVLQRFNVDESFHIEIVGVHQDYREQQIGKKLFEAGIDLAKTKNCQLVSVDCTNIYTSKIAEKLGMECVSIVTYDEYNDHLGKCLFVPIPPHVEVKTFVKKL